MTMTLTEVEEQARLLSQEQQLQLAHDLLAQQLQDLDSACLDEVERRATEIDRGNVKLVQASEVFAMARANLRAAR